jgi:hypothetical protein
VGVLLFGAFSSAFSFSLFFCVFLNLILCSLAGGCVAVVAAAAITPTSAEEAGAVSMYGSSGFLEKRAYRQQTATKHRTPQRSTQPARCNTSDAPLL